MTSRHSFLCFYIIIVTNIICASPAKCRVSPENFWNEIIVENNPRLNDKEYLTQLFYEYADLLNATPDSKMKKTAVDSLFRLIENNQPLLFLFEDISNRILYGIDSPFYNEESFIPFLQHFSKSDLIGEAFKERYAFRLEIANKNRPGKKIPDFKFISRDGGKNSINKIHVNNRLLLIFYDPDCENCKKTMNKLAEDDNLNLMIQNGDMTVVAIYSGEDRELWEKSNHELPLTWIVGYEPGEIEEKDLFFFRSYPSIYLLDKNKRVLLKDMRSSDKSFETTIGSSNLH